MNRLEEKLNELISITDNIKIKYKQLKTMEQSDMKDENVFKSICLELNNLYNLEQQFYQNNYFTKDDILIIMETLIDKNTFDPTDTMEDILHNTKNFDSYQRIFNHFYTIFKYDTKECDDQLDGIPDIIKSALPIERMKKQIHANYLFEKNVLNNYYLVLESFINRYLETDTEYKNALIHLKYLLSFLNSDIEKEFINNNFVFKTDLYLNYLMTGDINKISRTVQKIKLNDTIFIIFAEESARLLNIEDKDINNNNKFDIMLSKIILRSTTVFFDEDFLKIRQNEFLEFTQEKYLMFLNNKYAIKSITNIYNNTKKDKSNYKYLSLKPF